MTDIKRIIDEATAWRCVKACAKYLRQRDDSPKAADDLIASVELLVALRAVPQAPQPQTELWRVAVKAASDAGCSIDDDCAEAIVRALSAAPVSPAPPRETPQAPRVLELARIGAEARHWDVTNDWLVINPGHNDAPHECSHPDCALVRAGGAQE